MTLPERLREVPVDRLLLGVGLLAAIELLLLRLLTRTFVHIPGLESLERPLSVLFELGRVAYYATVVMVVITLGIIGLRSFFDAAQRWLVGLPVTGFLLAATGARLKVIGPVTAAWIAVGCVVILAVAAPTGRRLVVGGLYAAATLALAATTGLQAGGGGLTPTRVEAFATAGEILVVMAGLGTLGLISHRPSRRNVLIGLGAGLLVAAMLTFSRSTVLILTLWAFGLAGHLPVLAYSAAFAAITVTVLATAGREPALAGGVLLLFSAGAGMISTYQSALAVAGLAAITHLGRPREPVPAAIDTAAA